jgi:lipoic acid synthetase
MPPEPLLADVRVPGSAPLRVRWLGTVPYREAYALQRAVHDRAGDDYLLLLEHPHVYTLGSGASMENVLVAPESVGADLVQSDRGGDVTYHGPGQLVGYPVLSIRNPERNIRDVIDYVRALEDALIETLGEFEIAARREVDSPGVWIGDDKIAAIGVRVSAGRTMHGFALNITTDLSMFGHIVPCGLLGRGVTSMAQQLGRQIELREVVEVLVPRLAARFRYPPSAVERQDVVWRHRLSYVSPFTAGAEARRSGVAPPDPLGDISARTLALLPLNDDLKETAAVAPKRGAHLPIRQSSGHGARLTKYLAQAGVERDAEVTAERPGWMKVRARFSNGLAELQEMTGDLKLHTVCEEAGCPNLFECWSERTAAFMILGKHCTRACGFCMVDTRKPAPVDEQEPERVAEAVARMGLTHVVVTSVARDDLADGGAAMFAATIRAIRGRSSARVEVLIPDCRGSATALRTLFDAAPDVLNHNLETVARLQRAARPSAAYSRSLALLALAKDVGLVTKSGLILGIGETEEEVRGAIADLRSVGVDILTLGQYLQPTSVHLPVMRWWRPEEFRELRLYALRLGFRHVEAGPLVRSSYHARRAMSAATASPRTEQHAILSANGRRQP